MANRFFDNYFVALRFAKKHDRVVFGLHKAAQKKLKTKKNYLVKC